MEHYLNTNVSLHNCLHYFIIGFNPSNSEGIKETDEQIDFYSSKILLQMFYCRPKNKLYNV